MLAAFTHRRFLWAQALAVAVALLAVSGFADAQTDNNVPRVRNADEGMDTHLFRPAVDSKGFFYVNGTDIIAHKDISFGLILDWGHHILRTTDDTIPSDMAGTECGDETCQQGAAPGGVGTGVPALVEDSFQGTFGVNYGILNRAVIGITIPVILMSGNEAYDIGNAGLYNSSQLSAQKISGIAGHAKLRLTRVDQTVGVAAIVQAGTTFGDAERDLGGEPGFWYWPRLAVENQFGMTRRFKVGLNVGFRGHTGANASFLNSSISGAPILEEGALRYGNLGTFGLGVSYRALDALDLVVETYGSFLLDDQSADEQKLSQEFIGGIKLFVERNSYLMLGGGSRAFSTGFEAADVRAVLGFVFEPSIGDRDGDGYKDDEDQCPDEPEDFDGFEDEDGCPDPDNDNDGILDVDDRCPNIPEDFDGDEDKDGCPEGDKETDRDGDGIPDSKDKCPDDPEDKDGFEDKDGCPDPDNDKDGILDVDDQCPNDPEDKDGFEDEDGCPDPDNDKDQIPDVEDKCPMEPETYNGHEDEDGCPDKGRVMIDGSDIVILDKIQFATASTKILPESMPIVEAVASTLKGHAEFLTIEIAGHADERSTDRYNLQLTKGRARSVLAALLKRGIAKKRLISQGYGEYCPLDKGSNPRAWEKNRRVEFKVVKTDEGDTGVDRGCARARAQGVLPPAVK